MGETRAYGKGGAYAAKPAKKTPSPELSLGWAPTEAFSDIRDYTARSLSAQVAPEKIKERIKTALADKDYGSAIRGIYEKSAIDASRTARTTELTRQVYDLLGEVFGPGVQRAPPVSGGRDQWADVLGRAYREGSRVYMENFKRGKRGADCLLGDSGLDSQITQAARLLQKAKYPTTDPQRADKLANTLHDKIVDHMCRVHHLKESKDLSVEEIAKGILSEMEEGHFRTKKGVK